MDALYALGFSQPVVPNRICFLWHLEHLTIFFTRLQDSGQEETRKGMLSWCGHSDISKGTGHTFNSQETRREASLHKIASFICVSFKPLWTDILGETATLLSLCYFSETCYVSAIWNNLGCFSTSSSSPSSGAGPLTPGSHSWLYHPGCNERETQEVAWAEQPTCSQVCRHKLQWRLSNFIQNLGSLFSHPASLSNLFHHFTTARLPQCRESHFQPCFLGRKGGRKAQSPAPCTPSFSGKERLFPATPKQSFLFLSLGPELGHRASLAVRNSRQVWLRFSGGLEGGTRDSSPGLH